MEAEDLLNAQRAYFETGATLPVPARKKALKALYQAIGEYEERICAALREDLGKSRSESYMCEIGLVKSEIGYLLRHVAGFAREKRVRTPLSQYVSRSYSKPSPYGCALILSPWNYPFLLTVEPLADALAAGNTVILKPSAYSPCTSAVLRELIACCFPPEHVVLVTGGREENTKLLRLDFNYILFTGSQSVGREVLQQAAERLIPVTLELGGKSPCIVDETANLRLAARRIIFGKLVNCGQTCVAPDYIFCHAGVKDRLIAELKKQIVCQYGERPLENENYGKIVNRKHYDRLIGLLDREKLVFGGETDENALRIAPALLDGVGWDDPVMREEIFGPILPVLTYADTSKAIRKVRSRPQPLALYVFSSDRRNIARWTTEVSFGGGCVNDTLIHLATSEMGFGGVGQSGMGAYHGKRGFETFSHYKSIVDKKNFLDLPMRYQPYTAWKDRLVRRFLK